MDPVKFTLDKKYAPHLSNLEQQLKKLQNRPADQNAETNMTPLFLELAQKQVLVRLKEMTILDWHSWFSDETDIYVITTIVDGTSQNPVSLELKDFPNIRKGGKLSIGVPFGVKMYQSSNNVPEYLDMRILVARNRQSVRNAGKALQDIHNNENFKDAINVLSGLLQGPAAIVTGQIDNLIGIIGSILSMEEDDKLLYYAVTVSKEFDDLGVGLHCDETQFVKFCYQIQVGQQQEQ